MRRDVQGISMEEICNALRVIPVHGSPSSRLIVFGLALFALVTFCCSFASGSSANFLAFCG